MNDSHDPSFSIYDFKKWLGNNMKNHQIKRPTYQTNQELVSEEVIPRLGIQRLQEHIKEKNNLEDCKSLAKLFKENGGIIKHIEGLDILVECNGQEFHILKGYIKKK